MIFADIPLGASVFLDANTLIYHFTMDPDLGPACTELMERIDSRDIVGLTSTHVLSEIAHRMMTIEASQLFGWPFQGIAYRLRQHAAEVQRLSLFQRSVDEVLASSVQVLTISPSLISTAATVSQQTGLLSNDALIVAIMRANGLNHLASRDDDFDRVPGLTRYTPA